MSTIKTRAEHLGEKPAFPTKGETAQEDGMTLRVYIATKVTAAIISSGHSINKNGPDNIVKMAYKYADEILNQS